MSKEDILSSINTANSKIEEKNKDHNDKWEYLNSRNINSSNRTNGNINCNYLVECHNCENCTDCFKCLDIKDSKYKIENIQFTKEEYIQFMRSLHENIKYKKEYVLCENSDSNFYWTDASEKAFFQKEISIITLFSRYIKELKKRTEAIDDSSSKQTNSKPKQYKQYGSEYSTPETGGSSAFVLFGFFGFTALLFVIALNYSPDNTQQPIAQALNTQSQLSDNKTEVVNKVDTAALITVQDLDGHVTNLNSNELIITNKNNSIVDTNKPLLEQLIELDNKWVKAKTFADKCINIGERMYVKNIATGNARGVEISKEIIKNPTSMLGYCSSAIKANEYGYANRNSSTITINEMCNSIKFNFGINASRIVSFFTGSGFESC